MAYLQGQVGVQLHVGPQLHLAAGAWRLGQQQETRAKALAIRMREKMTFFIVDLFWMMFYRKCMPQESIKRTHLANIRTFLSWIRTGLASAGGGLAVIRFLNVRHTAMLGGLLVFLGITIFILAFIDYRKSCQEFATPKSYAGSLGFVCLMSFILVVVSLALLLILL